MHLNKLRPSFILPVVLLNSLTRRSNHYSAQYLGPKRNTLLLAEMEPARASFCSTSEHEFLDLSDPFLDLNQAFGFSLASFSSARESGHPTAMFEEADMAMRLPNRQDLALRSRDDLSTMLFSRLDDDADSFDNELLGSRKGASAMFCVPQVQHYRESVRQNPCAVSATVLTEPSNGHTKSVNG